MYYSILSVVNEHRDESVPRQTALLSATLSEGVQRLAGLSLKDPVYIDASSIGDTDSECLAIPDSLLQYYVLAPPKLRLVTLSGVLLQKLQVKINYSIKKLWYFKKFKNLLINIFIFIERSNFKQNISFYGHSRYGRLLYRITNHCFNLFNYVQTPWKYDSSRTYGSF